MHKPAVFVSSTCYDLKQVRADLHRFLEDAGFEAVLSEFPTFPVDPAAANVENCRRAVENRADVFVLIVGNRYGSTDQHGKSITNLEYLTARAKGIPIYVFVLRSIIDVLPLWKDNPHLDFKNIVDSPSLFQFVNDLRESGKLWVFPFDLAQDIVSILRTQLGYLFSDLLRLRLRIASRPEILSGKYSEVSGKELQLVIDRPRAWEYLLFNAALRRELDAAGGLKRDAAHGIAFGFKTLTVKQFLIDFVPEKLKEPTAIIQQMEVLLQAAHGAFRPPGQSGDPEEIIYVANRIGAVYRAALNWKIEFHRLILDDRLVKLRSLAASILDTPVREIEEYVSSLESKLAEAIAFTEGGATARVDAILRLSSGDLSEFNDEFRRLCNIDWSDEED